MISAISSYAYPSTWRRSHGARRIEANLYKLVNVLRVHDITPEAAVYREFKRKGKPEEVPGFCRVATIEEVREHGYALTSGRHVGTEELEDEGEPFEERMPPHRRFVTRLERRAIPKVCFTITDRLYCMPMPVFLPTS